MISPDAYLLAGVAVFVLGAQQWFLHWQNRKQSKEWMQLLSYMLQEYSLHRHEKDGSITYPKIKLGRPVNGKLQVDGYT